jgi:hypothetical protein
MQFGYVGGDFAILNENNISKAELLTLFLFGFGIF